MALPQQDDTHRPSSENYNFCALPLAPFACRPDMSKGRLHDEPESSTRTPFQRDRDRIIHCSAFRRLKYKTQVFVYHEGDHYRTRLTHTIEVAQIARTLARSLLINEDLAEAVALAHDLGHAPFAHIGEIFLQQCMEDYGGFDHNDQSLRVVTMLERKYPRWAGLNLSWETLEGIIKHNGPVTRRPLPVTLRELSKTHDFRLKSHAPVEAQAAALADDIAYNNHDVEDGLKAGFFTLDELEELELLGNVINKARHTYPAISESLLIQEVIREMIGAMVGDVLNETRKRLEELSPESPDDIRKAGKQVVAFSKDMEKNVKEMRAFLFERMYRHYTIDRIRLKVEQIIPQMFDAFMTHPNVLPQKWQDRLAEIKGLKDQRKKARLVTDYIAGMTDRFALREHERMFELHHWDIR